MPARSRRIIHQQAQVSSFETFYSNPESTVLLHNNLARLQLFVNVLKVAVGPKRSTNRNLKEIITIECTKTVIFQLLRPLGISKLGKKELIQ